MATICEAWSICAWVTQCAEPSMASVLSASVCSSGDDVYEVNRFTISSVALQAESKENVWIF